MQAYANELANAQSDQELARQVAGLLAKEGVAAPGAGIVMIGHDTRPSGPGLAAAAAAGVRCLGLEAQMCGLLTTPQLHWMVMSRNRGEPCGEEDYYAALAGAYKQLVAGTQPLGQVCRRRWEGRVRGRQAPVFPLRAPPLLGACRGARQSCWPAGWSRV